MSTPVIARSTLVTADALTQQLENPAWAIVDCRFDLKQPARGGADYRAAHIPGAVYADLDRDLSSPVRPGVTGRHPLPALDLLVARLGQWGIDGAVQVVAYDDAGGMYAARLWWLLRRLGHARVAVLDGDWRAWQRAQLPTRSGDEQRPPRTFIPDLETGQTLAGVAEADEIAAHLGTGDLLLLDARAADRFRGENETLDVKAGHIPGARSAPYAASLDSAGLWHDAATLRSRYLDLLHGTPPAQAVAYCGSGVSACHTLLALEAAGLPGARLYPGSWSHWITDPAHPVALGDAA